MIVEKLETPFGYFEVLHNGKRIEFSVTEGTYNTIHLGGDTPVSPDGCYSVNIETLNMKPGDVIIGRYSVSGLEYDGGGENTLNALVETDDYTIGIGCCDTDDLENLWEIYRSEEGAREEDFPTQYMLPYAHWGITKDGDGFEFRITDNPKDYRQYPNSNYYRMRTVIPLTLVWNKNEDEYAWTIVSTLTC